MSAQDKYLYPVTPETLHKYAEDIFAPVRRGECVTTVWVPMAGRRMWNKFINENIYLFEKELPHYDKYLLVYIEPLDLTEESLAGYIRLMAKSFIEVATNNENVKNDKIQKYTEIFDDDKATYSLLLTNLKHLLKETTDSGLEIVFFVGEFDELTFANTIFYNNLKSLWSQLYPRLHYIFLMRERVTRKENISLWGELNEAILQNIVYVPLAQDKDVDYWIDNFSSHYSFKINEKQKQVLKKLCGGHPYMLKVAVRVINKHKDDNLSGDELEDFLLDYYELRSVSRGILDVRSDKERKLLLTIAKGSEFNVEDHKEYIKFFEKLGLVKKDDKGQYHLFGKLFEDAVLGTEEPKESHSSTETNGDLNLDENTGAILFKGKTVEERFTRQEYSILTAFLQNEGKLLTRDDAGAVLWGKESYEKYSDWAIDQLISKLRKKLNELGVKDKLSTVRGKGYKYIKA
ncbi:hypothetical protein A2715_00825 [Candidatus Woesebacteria bacterium RIFCSPHIGHO2_01_FULL_39_32]|uniref:OmpR/PhoB-type domain-containing protein n=2 Tax=Candidatus Woeseibacteriota TaxID=1752722 RepID=A0A0G0PNI7_9BACT|nr:MAG: hypothetical protein UT61_C0022G0002 [Candidatus Woesebacteria bacterium GW2011_GWA1_39_8]OGM05008.1 MAG: hypothetical protein A2124_03625 [Candidatus Woesebacteria bacterium GWB1_37_5]OGM24457.1 MAG: hypothetical protein A2715_00825 [Candidatus Woesebacteria bacterium RIFCSPHIGHO2_01_FULL_39_32]OGM36993.1 MAG: hypothetical protein A3F01_05130 [Candidatus Woesebacteria bacterium RIFCSPHIGHO2_12_FULL_38_11]OGM63763.1 MAG: hypothetical protein A2893_02160 [Candidatus Woesebacteria bacteri